MIQFILVLLFPFLLRIDTTRPQRSKDLLLLNSFHGGEYVRYKVIYKFSEAWVTAGQLIFEIENRMIDSQKYIACIARGNTAPAFDIFYKVRDEYGSIINPATLQPRNFFRRVNEGGFKIYNDLHFHQDSLYVTADVEDSKSPQAINDYSILPNTQDLVSAIMYSRSLDYNALDSGGSYQFPLFIDNELQQIGIKYLGKKTIVVDYGEFNCLVLQPQLLSGRVFGETDQMRIYITDDPQRIPVYIESPLRVGKIVAVLNKYRK